MSDLLSSDTKQLLLIGSSESMKISFTAPSNMQSELVPAILEHGTNGLSDLRLQDFQNHSSDG